MEFPHRAAWQHRLHTVALQFLLLFPMPPCQVTCGDGCADAQDVTLQSLQDVVYNFARPIVPTPCVEFMDKDQEIRIVVVAIQGARPESHKCTSSFCQSHCNSRRCQVHMNRPQCSTAECDSPAPGCLVGACAAHYDHWQCSRAKMGRGTPEEATCCRTHVGILHAMNACTQNAVHDGAPSIAPADFVRSTRPQTAGSSNPVRDGPAIPSSESLCVASLNARRLWQRDQSVHDVPSVLRFSS